MNEAQDSIAIHKHTAGKGHIIEVKVPITYRQYVPRTERTQRLETVSKTINGKMIPVQVLAPMKECAKCQRKFATGSGLTNHLTEYHGAV